MITEEQAREALSGVMDPELGHNLVELGMVRNLQVDEGQVSFDLALTILACPFKDKIVEEARAAVLALDGVEAATVNLTEMTAEERERIFGGKEKQGLAERFNHIEHVVAVVSGKGGVGKSLVAGLLAAALRREGHEVGVLDADITGPSIPKMFLPTQRHPGSSPLGLLPVESETAIKQFWGDVVWGNLDYLVVDLPPGTADASLTVMQSIPLSGVVLVTSPQGLAAMVVRKAARMARAMGVPILGVVENMSYVVCPDTGKRLEVFGPSKTEAMAAQLGVPLLGRLPIDPQIAQLCDEGRIEEYQSDAFAAIAKRVSETAPKPSRSRFYQP